MAYKVIGVEVNNMFSLDTLKNLMGGVSKSMLKQSRLNFDKIEKCE